MTEPRLKVAVCGAAIGGLFLAAIISKYASDDIQLDIYEAKPQISADGSAISIWKRTWPVLQNLGLDEELDRRNIPRPKEGKSQGPIFRKADQPEPGYDFHSHIMPYGPTSINRPQLLEMLQSKISSRVSIHLSHKLLRYESSSDDVQLFFANGRSATADVLVGADGIHSSVRQTMFAPQGEEQLSKYGPPKWSGTLAYRCFVDVEELNEIAPDHQAKQDPKIWCGKDKHVVSNPHLRGMISVICFHSFRDAEGTPFKEAWSQDVEPSQVLSSFSGWEPDLIVLLKLIKTPVRWAIHVIEPLPQMVDGKVALLGDAAHAMAPHQGVGGGQVIEDAHILGRLLADPRTTRDNVATLLKQVYEPACLPPAILAAERSRENGYMYEFNHPDFLLDAHSPKSEFEALGKAVGKSFLWLAEGSCVENWETIERGLASRFASFD